MGMDGHCGACDAVAESWWGWASCCLQVFAGYPPLPHIPPPLCFGITLWILSVAPVLAFLSATAVMIALGMAKASRRGLGLLAGFRLLSRRQRVDGVMRNLALTADMMLTTLAVIVAALATSDEQAFGALCLSHAAAASLWAIACRRDWRLTALFGLLGAIVPPLYLLERHYCQRMVTSTFLLLATGAKVALHGGIYRALQAVFLLVDAVSRVFSTRKWLLKLRLYFTVKRRI